MTIEQIKVLGERNTGTNLLEDLLTANTTVPVVDNDVGPRYVRFIGWMRRRLSRPVFYAVSEPLRDVLFSSVLRGQHGWKHAAVTDRLLRSWPDSLAVVAITKDPYAWARSLFEHPYHRKPAEAVEGESFSEFLRRPWSTVRREHTARVLANPIELWNVKTRSYAALLEREGATVCRYEALIEDVPATLRSIGEACGFEVATGISVPEQSVKADQRSTASIIEHYRNRHYLDHFSASDLAFVNEHLDPVAVRISGCEVVESER